MKKIIALTLCCLTIAACQKTDEQLIELIKKDKDGCANPIKIKEISRRFAREIHFQCNNEREGPLLFYFTSGTFGGVDLSKISKDDSGETIKIQIDE